MKFKNLVFILLFFSVVPEVVFAQDAQIKSEESLAIDQVQSQFEVFAQKKGINYGVRDSKGATYYCASESVSENLASPNYIKSRLVAYERAYQKILKEVLYADYGRNVVEVLSSINEDFSSDAFTPSANSTDIGQRIEKKLGQLTEAKLDAALRECGIDSSNMDGRTIVEKRNIFLNQMLKKSITKASGDISGLMVVDTIEGRSNTGRCAIGVIVKLSAENRAIIKCILAGQVPPVSKRAISVNEYLDAHSLSESFGVRMIADENGRPAIIAFGQWGTTYTGSNERMMERDRNHAKQQACENANRAMTEVLSLNLYCEKVSETGETEETNVLFDQNGSAFEDTINNITDRFREQSKGFATAMLAGRGVVLNKIVKHPDSGRDIAVAAVVWSSNNLEESKARREVLQRPDRVVTQEKSEEFSSGVRTSGSIDMEYDW